MAPFRRAARHRPVGQRHSKYARQQAALAEAKARAELIRFQYFHLR